MGGIFPKGSFVGGVRNRAPGLCSKYSLHSHPVAASWLQESPHHTLDIPPACWVLLPKLLPVAMGTAVQLHGPGWLQLYQCKLRANSRQLMELLQISMVEGGAEHDQSLWMR